MQHPRSPRVATALRPPENYLASVSDLMVGLLFVFILLLMAFALEVRPEPTAGRPSPAVPAAAGAPTTGGAGAVAVAEAYGARDRAIAEIRKELASRGVIVHVDLQNGILRLPEELLFDVGRAELRPGAVGAIRRIATELTYYLPHCPLLEAVVVEGHTDDRPIRGVLADGGGTWRDNWDLAYHRAKRVQQGLVAATPALGRMQNDHGQPVLALGAFGPARPVATNRTAAGRGLNRRIDLRMVLSAPRPLDMEASAR